MSKYIDADLLRRKIAEQMESLPREVGRGAGTITSKGYGMMEAFQIVRSIIDSLQQEQPEVYLNENTLKKEFRMIDSACLLFNYDKLSREQLIARRFYQLGLKARKEE